MFPVQLGYFSYTASPIFSSVGITDIQLGMPES
jgi:hypothetical protein